MFLATPEMMRCSALQEDEGRLVILSLVTIAACVSVVAVGFIPHSKETVNTVFLMHFFNTTILAITINIVAGII